MTLGSPQPRTWTPSALPLHTLAQYYVYSYEHPYSQSETAPYSHVKQLPSSLELEVEPPPFLTWNEIQRDSITMNTGADKPLKTFR
jgi:hypothetical protein